MSVCGCGGTILATKDPLLDKREIFEEYLRRSPQAASVYSFVNIFAWKDFFHFKFKVTGDCLCIFARDDLGTFLYLPPLGKAVPLDVIEECFSIMEDENGQGGVTRIENVTASQLHLFPQGKYVPYKKGYEYCYYRDDIACLRGNDYKSKRSSYNQFVNGNTPEYIPYEESMFDECLRLYDQWADCSRDKGADDIAMQMIRENRRVHETVLRNSRKLGIVGRVVSLGGCVRAYTFGFAVNPSVFCVLFEIVDHSAKGLPVYIFSQFCRDAEAAPYKFINVMDDFGMDRVKQTKLSFRPSVLLPLYCLNKRY